MTDRAPQGGFREMLLLELIEQYGPSYPEGRDWQKTAAFLYDEEPDHMADLTASLAARGWRDPIRLSEPEDLEEGDEPLVLNGTHRISVALREGVISVPVCTHSEWKALQLEDPELMAMLTVRTADPLSEDEMDRIFDVLRSFELTEDIWLNSDYAFGTQGGWEFFYEELTDEAPFALLKRKARARLEKAFPNHKFTLVAELKRTDGEDEGA